MNESRVNLPQSGGTAINATIVPNHVVLNRTRVRDAAGYRGTVRYVGPVATSSSASTVYAGIEWDDETRGKHNGSVLVCPTSGTRERYFTTRHNATSGSFVKLPKLDWGVALNASVWRERYVEGPSPECVAPDTLLPHTAQTVSGRNDKPIQLLGELQIRQRQQVEDLTTLSLRHDGIASIDASNFDQWTTLQHVRDVDLAGNLLCDWHSVWQLLTALPLLDKLSVASNFIGDWSMDDVSKHNLQHLNVHDTRIQSMDTVLNIGRTFPNLAELILANNGSKEETLIDDTADVDSPSINLEHMADELARVFLKLRFLDVSHCPGLLLETNGLQTVWSRLPVLQVLSLDDNPQLTRFTPATMTVPVFYPALQQLQVSGTCLTSWTDVATWYSALPSLTRVRFNAIAPLTAHESNAVIRRRLVYLLPHVTLLNGSVVTTLERRDAARHYYRQYEQYSYWPATTTMAHTNDNPFERQDDYWLTQFPELGARDVARRTSASPTSTVDTGASTSTGDFDVINVTIQSFAPSSCTMAPLIRRLPSHLAVAKVKALCARQFGLDIDLQELWFRRDTDAVLEPLYDQRQNDDTTTLHEFGVPDGAVIVMQEVDLAAVARQEQRAQTAIMERTQQQERERMDFLERQKLANM